MSVPCESVSTTDAQPVAGNAHATAKRLLTIQEAAAHLNAPATWVSQAARQRKVRSVRLGKHIRFRPEDLEELIAASETPVTVALMPRPRDRRRARL